LTQGWYWFGLLTFRLPFEVLFPQREIMIPNESTTSNILVLKILEVLHW
jgi:hypothetical protein